MQIDSIQATALATIPSAAPVSRTPALDGEFIPPLPVPRPEAETGNPSSAANGDGLRDVEEAIDAFNKAAEPFDIALKFSRDDKTGRVIIEMLDQSTGETLRQIPDATALRLSAMLGRLQGLLVNRQM